MYLPDLSPYDLDGKPTPDLVCIGWLDPAHEYPRGRVSDDLLERTLALCILDPVRRMRGFHCSPFLQQPPFGLPAYYRGRRMLLGSAEIRVPGPKRSYAAPNLVYHYMKDCGYLPPAEFVEALMAMPAPG